MGGRLIDWLGSGDAVDLPDATTDMPSRVAANGTALYLGTDNQHLYVYDPVTPTWYDLDLASLAALSTEDLQDMIAAFIVQDTGINIVYDDAGNALRISCTVTQYTDEMAQDAIAALIAAGTDTGLTITYNDAGNFIGFTVSLASFSIDALSDVDTTTTPPAGGDVLTWSAAHSKWEPAAPSGGGGSSIGTHRYWGLLQMGSPAGSPQIQDIVWYSDAAFTTSVAPTAYVASSEFGGGAPYAASGLLVSGGAYWAANSNFNQWLYADFGTAKSLRSIRLTPVSAALNQFPTQFTFAYSDDGKLWTPIRVYAIQQVASASNIDIVIPATLP